MSALVEADAIHARPIVSVKANSLQQPAGWSKLQYWPFTAQQIGTITKDTVLHVFLQVFWILRINFRAFEGARCLIGK